jgi:DNA-binding NarL/FixJ family response regulator
MSPYQFSVLLVDDDAMVRSWVRLSLEGSEFRLAGVASTVGEVLELARKRAPDVLLVDYRLPDGMGTELVRQLRGQGVTAPAVLMTANPERGFSEAAREAGAQGTALKTGSIDEFFAAMRAVVAGEDSFDGRHPSRSPGRAALSPRERDVLRLVAAGTTNRDIAAALDVSGETVKTLLNRTFTKLGVHRRAEAVATAHKLGIL